MTEFLERPDLLTLLILTPLVGALILLFVPGRRVNVHRWGALVISLVAFTISLLVAVPLSWLLFATMVERRRAPAAARSGSSSR